MSPSSDSGRRCVTTPLIVACLCATLWTGCSVRRSQQYADQGNTYLRLGDVDTARAQFKEALEADPKNAEAKLGLGHCLRLQGHTEEAVTTFRQAIELDPGLASAYVAAVRLLLDSDAESAARSLARQYSTQDPERGGILEAFVLRESGKPADAIELLGELRTQFANSMAIRVALAQAHLAAGQPELAEQELVTALAELDAESLAARMVLINAYAAQDKLPDITNQLGDLVDQHPGDMTLKLAFARSLLESGDLIQAASLARAVLDQEPASPWANYVIGSCLLVEGELAEAIDRLEAAARGLPDQDVVKQRLDKARRLGEPADRIRAPVDSPLGPIDTGWQGLWHEARLSELVENRASYPNQSDPELRDTVVLAALFSGNMPLAKRLADDLHASPGVRDYLDVLEQADAQRFLGVIETWDDSTNHRRELLMNAEGFGYAFFGARGKALRTLSECLETWPDRSVALLNLSSMYRSARMPHHAARCLERLVGKHGENIEARFLLFSTLFGSGLLQEARRSAEVTYAVAPSEPRALTNLARAYGRAGDTAIAADILRQGALRFPDNTMVRIALADALMRAGEPLPARETLGSGPREADALVVLAFCAAQLGDWPAVIEACRDLRLDSASHVRFLFTAACIHTGQAEEAASALINADGSPVTLLDSTTVLGALGILPDGYQAQDPALARALSANTEAVATFAQAQACQAASLFAEAFELYNQTDRLAPGQRRVVELALSNLALAEGLADRIPKAADFTEKYTTMAEAWVGLSQVCRSSGETEHERSALDNALTVDPANRAVLVARVAFFERQGDFEQSLNTLRLLADAVPDDPRIKNNLAYSILQTNVDAREALALASLAREQLGLDPAVLHTLGLAQLRIGDLEEGQKNLLAALELRPGDPTLLLDLGQLLIAMDRTEDGKRQIEAALDFANQIGVAFPRRAEAERILER